MPRVDEARRSGRWFEVNFVVPLPWILGVIAVALLQAGIFYNQFVEQAKTLEKIERLVSNNNSTIITHTQQLIDHERRMDNLERKR